MNKSPLVSILMPVHNGQKHLGLAVDSILKQTFRDYELLILDDASTDDSRRIAQSYHDSRILLKHFAKKSGLAAIRQAGVDLSKGKLIAFLDSDDYSLPDRLRIQTDYLSKHPEIGILGSWTQIIDENNRRSNEVWKHAVEPENIKVFFLFRNCLTQSTVIMRRSCFTDFKYRQEYWPAPDFDLWTRLSGRVKIANLPQVLSYYRISDKNMTGRHQKEIEECTHKIFGNSLKFLGLQPDRQSVVLHDSLERTRPYREAGRLMAVENWLLTLLAANRKKELYDVKIFRRVLADYWFKTCLLTANRGLPIWRHYLNSPLAGNLRKNRKKELYLLFASLIHKSKLVDISSQAWLDLVYG